ncbi:alpha-methylacyl-CoA racemase isoform X1 [Dermatophagoides farinae]|uniref:Alpha-methylacyl-CoA racemase n=2 Tax=Dermatophagoides farinae TaxID=6954 RepID=A0A922HX84_DERFA|nr:alpha-methylacyl-CoA racemase-like [Dermatophagoides farinae]KAH9516216.1 hypothetical protein DERF_006970 [Dermatophagoides farinae]
MMAPLKGVKVIELVGLAPAPFLGLILSDFGARVIRVDNLDNTNGSMFSQQKESMYLNLKHPKGSEILQRLTEKSDVLIDPYRPGVLERLELGPERLCQLNPGLVFARLSGYGQTGPMARKASHDINFLSLSGVMSRFGYNDRPPIAPLNLMGDIGGGSILCAMAIVMALYERNHSGKGQIIDHSMTEGVGYLGSFLWESLKQKELLWPNWPNRGQNTLDFGSPFYRCYECADGKFMAVGALEEKFYQNLLHTLGFEAECFNRFDTESWPEMVEEIGKKFKTKTRDEWTHEFEKADACVTPVLNMEEVTHNEHNRIRKSYDPNSGYPNPAPRFSRTPAIGNREGCMETDGKCESQSRDILIKELGYTEQELEEFGSDVYN